MAECRPQNYPKLKDYKPSRFMLPTCHYDAAKADRAVTFIENLRHTKGKWAGKRFWLLPWQEQIIRDVFGIVDEKGNRTLIYPKDTLIRKVTTDEKGEAVLADLPLGTYLVKETKAPTGFVLNSESKEITFLYKDQDTPVVEETVEFSNKRQKVDLKVVKEDAENGKKLEGAEFGIYNKNDILSGDKVIVKADTLLQKVMSDKNGLAQFTLDLPLGKYYVKELQAPDGYVSSDEIMEFDASYQGQDVKVVKLSATKKNQPTTVEITKADVTTGVELDGASLLVLNKKGEVVDSWTSVKDKPHVIKGLKVGETYTLREQIAPYGYLRTTDITFQISDTAEVQKVRMEDDVPIARLLVNKKGEFLDDVTLLDNAKGVVEHFFSYVTGSLTDVSFNVYAAEDIRAADGVSENYYTKDQLVGTITTDGTGIAELDNLPLGKYYIVEKETSYGYVLDDEPRYVDLTYRDQDTPVVTYSADWQNRRQKVQINVLKKEKDSDKVLSGAIFGLFAAEDITSAGGKVLIEKDTIIELKTTDESGWIHFMADLPISAKYYLKEIYAPNGYVRGTETQEFTFEYQGDKTTQAVYEFTFEDVQTSVELSKADLTDGKELPGASLQVLDSTGTVVEEWISTEEPHMIRGLLVGETYTMVETKPADGYTTAESIEFKVEDTAEVQKHQMLDDVTKVEISKTDVTDSKEVPGAKLTILDKDGKVVESWVSDKDPHMVEKLPVGTYTLREEQAPDGYLVAEEVSFDVKDTGEIQKVEMKDARPTGKLILKKTDAEDGSPLAGAEFELRIKKSGKVVATLVTDEEGVATSGDIPIATYKDGKMKKEIEYILVETKAPEGYKLNPDPIEAKVTDLPQATTGDTTEGTPAAITPVWNTVTNAKLEGSITIKKRNADETPLTGAEFQLEVYDKASSTWVSSGIANQTTGADGIAKFDHLVPGKYRLTEVKAPAGYNLLNSSREITIPYELNVADVTEPSTGYTEVVGNKIYYYDVTLTFYNSLPFDVPSTGGTGGMAGVTAGMALMLGTSASAWLLKRKKRKLRAG